MTTLLPFSSLLTHSCYAYSRQKSLGYSSFIIRSSYFSKREEISSISFKPRAITLKASGRVSSSPGLTGLILNPIFFPLMLIIALTMEVQLSSEILEMQRLQSTNSKSLSARLVLKQITIVLLSYERQRLPDDSLPEILTKLGESSSNQVSSILRHWSTFLEDSLGQQCVFSASFFHWQQSQLKSIWNLKRSLNSSASLTFSSFSALAQQLLSRSKQRALKTGLSKYETFSTRKSSGGTRYNAFYIRSLCIFFYGERRPSSNQRARARLTSLGLLRAYCKRPVHSSLPMNSNLASSAPNLARLFLTNSYISLKHFPLFVF